MDYSEFQKTIIQEVITWQDTSVSKATTLRFQNHLYGCLVILEYLGEDQARLEDKVLIIQQNDINTNLINLQEQFKDIGSFYGFLQIPEMAFDAWSENYRNAWLWAWTTIGIGKKLDTIDEFEKHLFESIQLEKLPFFKNAMTNGSISSELEKEALELLHPKQKTTTVSKTRRKRAITPILRKKYLRKTHKKSIQTRNILQPSNL